MRGYTVSHDHVVCNMFRSVICNCLSCKLTCKFDVFCRFEKLPVGFYVNAKQGSSFDNLRADATLIKLGLRPLTHLHRAIYCLAANTSYFGGNKMSLVFKDANLYLTVSK